MNKSLKSLAAVVVVLFAIAIAGLVTMTAVRGEERTPVTGGMERVISHAEDANLSVAAMAIGDVYGPEYVLGLVACPGTESSQVSDVLGIENIEGLPATVEQDRNYLLLIDQNGDAYADGVDIARINLCTSPQLIASGFQAQQVIVFGEAATNPLAPVDAATPWALLG